MDDWRAAFDQILFDRLIPEFCSDPERNCHSDGFRRASVKVAERDARDFLRAWDAGLMEHQGRGQYRASNSAACEQFFWTGRRSGMHRSFTLWLEPVITVAGLARLHFDYGWPKHLIGTQSPDWAFDLVTLMPGRSGEFIAGEVKKSPAEIDDLIKLMQHFGREPSAEEPIESGKSRNAYKKVIALRSRRAPVFWALGPDGLSKTFDVQYHAKGKVGLNLVGDAALRCPAI